MTTTQFSSKAIGKWEEQKTKLKIQFPGLSDVDLDYDASEKTEMLATLATKLSIPVEELQVIIETL
jgi:hypothetical protein